MEWLDRVCVIAGICLLGVVIWDLYDTSTSESGLTGTDALDLLIGVMVLAIWMIGLKGRGPRWALPIIGAALCGLVLWRLAGQLTAEGASHVLIGLDFVILAFAVLGTAFGVKDWLRIQEWRRQTRRARECFDREDYWGAVRVSSRVIELAPHDAWGYQTRAAAYQRLGWKRHAEEDHREAKRLNPVSERQPAETSAG